MEMVQVTPEEEASFQESGARVCVAEALTMTSGVLNSLEPVRMDAECNRLMMQFTVNPTGTVYLLGANDPGGAWTIAASYNFNAFGYIALTPPSSGFGFFWWKVVVLSSSGTIVLGDLCIWCSPG
jgi:hypothetical protein